MAARVISQAEREASRERMKRWWSDPANRAKVSERQRQRMLNDSEYREKTFGAMTSFEAQQRAAEAIRQWFNDPEKRAERVQRRAEITKASWANPEQRAKRLAAIAAANATPEAKANRQAGGRLGAAKRAQKSGRGCDEPIVRRVPQSRAKPIPLDPIEAMLFGVKR